MNTMRKPQRSEKVRDLTRCLAKSRALKQAIMQELLTGRIRLV